MAYYPIQTVLSTPELLEIILLELEMSDLLTSAQLVCHNWRDTIERSPQIQQALFFRPRSDGPYQDVVSCSSPRAPAPSGPTTRTLNPLLDGLFAPLLQTSKHHFRNYAGSLEKHPLNRRRAAILRTGASWRRMLVQQPPARSMGHVQTRSGHGLPVYARTYLPFDEDGVRMGVLYDLVQAVGVRFLATWQVLFRGTQSERKIRGEEAHLTRVNRDALIKSEIVLFSHYWDPSCLRGLPVSEEAMKWVKLECKESQKITLLNIEPEAKGEF